MKICKKKRYDETVSGDPIIGVAYYAGVVAGRRCGGADDRRFPGPDHSRPEYGDGTIDILDLVSIIDYIVNDTAPTSLTNADANGDGIVDIMDLVWVIDQIVGG